MEAKQTPAQQKQQQSVQIAKLAPQQLLQLQKRLEEEIVGLNRNFEQFQQAISKYDDNKVLLKSMETKGNTGSRPQDHPSSDLINHS